MATRQVCTLGHFRHFGNPLRNEKSQMAGADTAVGLLAASIWRLTHLAVGTFGGCQMAVRAKWLLGRLAVGTIGGRQMAVRTRGVVRGGPGGARAPPIFWREILVTMTS